MKINDIYEVTIINEDMEGNGIARIDNFVIFIFGALKNEKVLIKIAELNKRFAKGKIVNIITKSPKRNKILCPIYDKCGGCNFLHTSYENERKIKKDEIERLFKRKVNYLNTNNSLNYRNKVVLHIKNNKIGFYDSKTHNICSFNTCYLLDSLINKTIYNIKEYDLTGVYEIMIRSVNNEVMVNIISDIENTPLLNIDVDSLYLNDKYIKGKEYLIDEINKYKFSIYPLSFYQINNEGMTSIYNKAKEYILGGDTLLDLYCGTGTIGIWMSDIFRKVVGVEINESSIKNANINKKLNNINNIEFICSDAKRIKGKFDSIIVDPPRNGLSKDVINYINNSNSKRLVYISCNYKTLKRDIDLLSNYVLKDISICDMFPRTKHVECVCVLERRQNIKR